MHERKYTNISKIQNPEMTDSKNLQMNIDVLLIINFLLENI